LNKSKFWTVYRAVANAFIGVLWLVVLLLLCVASGEAGYQLAMHFGVSERHSVLVGFLFVVCTLLGLAFCFWFAHEAKPSDPPDWFVRLRKGSKENDQ
jgi:uncharacterized BrkB/YihY/UPF0761 family membrane protein